jgi:outer membrane protein TolC
MSYYRAKQQADNVNIAEERRRKVLQNIVQEVRDAWRALGHSVCWMKPSRWRKTSRLR